MPQTPPPPTPRTPQPLHGRLLDQARLQDRVFSRREAIRSGFKDTDLRSWVREGVVVHASRGAYYLAPDRDAGWGDLTSSEQAATHARLRILALLHVTPMHFVASHDSALRLLQLPTLEAACPGAIIHLTSTNRAVTKPRRPGVHIHRPTPNLTVAKDHRAVSIEHAIVQTGCLHGLLAALIPADAAMHEGRLDLQLLTHVARRVAGMPGASKVRELAGLIDGRLESPGETWLRLICHDAGIAVIPQVKVADNSGVYARVDFLVEGTNVVLEFDGLTKYDDPESLRQEKIREQRLHRAGYLVVRITWAELSNAPAVVARIRAAIARAQRMAALDA